MPVEPETIRLRIMNSRTRHHEGAIMRLTSLLTRRFSTHADHSDETSTQAMRRQWDAMRTQATTQSERAEIDALFSRSMP